MFELLKQADKRRHLYVGIILTILFQWIGFYCFPNTGLAIFIANFVLVFLIAYGFELFSKFTGIGHYDFKDVIATIIGYPIGLFLFYLPIYFADLS